MKLKEIRMERERQRRNKWVASRLVNRQVKVVIRHGSKGLDPLRRRDE